MAGCFLYYLNCSSLIKKNIGMCPNSFMKRVIMQTKTTKVAPDKKKKTQRTILLLNIDATIFNKI